METSQSSHKRRKLDHSLNGFPDTSTAGSFALQTEQLLHETRVNYATTLGAVHPHLHEIKTAIESIDAHDPILISKATHNFEELHQIAIPYPAPAPADDAPYKLSYQKPSYYHVVGSFALKTMVGSADRLSVDMAVEMPSSMFQEKDYLDMRYFYRRAYFLANIAAGLRKELGKRFNMAFESLNENPLLPILVLKPRSFKSEPDDVTRKEMNAREDTNRESLERSYGVAIRVIPCANEALFPTTKLSASSCCNRPREESDNASPTPFYNSTLKAEMNFVSYLRIIARSKKACIAFQDACKLGRLWLQQRGFGSSVSKGGFGNFEWSLTIALLMQSGGGEKSHRKLSSSLSSSEIFKAAIQFIASTNFVTKPFYFSPSVGDASNPRSASAREGALAMVEPTGDLNLLFKMSPWSAALLQHHAKLTLELLKDDAKDPFPPTFITKANLPLQMFDLVFEVRSGGLESASKLPSLDCRGPVWDFSSELYRVLKEGLGDRAKLLQIQQQDQGGWDLKYPRNPDTSSNVLVGVAFNPESMARFMEYGPPAEERKKAAKFQEFWGDKAELRRFKDGRILECVEWTKRSAFDICEEICRYVLGRHLRLGFENLQVYGGGFSSIISMKPSDRDIFDAARKTFQIFESDIRELEDLPLQVRQLAPIAPEQRYSSIGLPMLGFHRDTLQLMEVNLYFEASSRWPENLTAIQEAKIEFLLDIDRRLTATHDNVTTYLGREDVELGIHNLAFLDVIYDNGAAFRLRVHCDLEEILLDRQAKNRALDQHTKTEAEEALLEFRWLYTLLPLHTQTIATFCTRLPTLSPTIRLVKHWFNSHKLRSHFSEELIELLVLYAFLNPHPWDMPSSGTTGFLRTMVFLSRWDWRHDPLVIDSDDSITAAQRSSIHKELAEWRKRDPNLGRTVLFVCTSHDQSGLAYTRRTPSRIAATRMTVLAKTACNLVREQGVELDAEFLFLPSLRQYDVLIHLSGKTVKKVARDASNGAGARHSQFKNLDERTGKTPLPLARHPAAVLLDELKAMFEDTLIFFHGGDEDGVIGAIWHLRLQRQGFRAGLGFNFRSASTESEEDTVEINHKAVLLEIARVGGDMVRTIEEVEA